ncbi:glycosyltransferase family 4 protein [Subsaximicrobium wynnwilliamsii]|uniref:Glycosyltransferase family 4 protein n=1 Tax=Subsaximicrobium wynnwilliamsii TaxID=291179 RepID=A0A5C6ZM91_9FLAO|nr:glycosyltransferase [Subsaximicrobium wynnwilliamsii]TXD84836.1 glycosyltransferase family 4 protein [Subsaximicrobium wynnwilliamsii]TXD90507.1 glycosyltransferase family 4 protein [Subsaximicrobium wynnwilliamsii]TXE04982.1 glycosyltransferase family 4 protein [Subsaximicrobium wynnwilliamsii]
MNKKLLIIGFVWPEPKSSAAGSRMLQLIYFFKAQDYQITFATACAKSNNAFDLEQIGVDKIGIKLNDASFDEFILKLKPDVVLFDRFMSEEQFGWRVADQLPEALRILDTEDLHFLRKAREAAFKSNAKNENDFLISDTTKREIASMYRCDLSLIISEAEVQLLRQRFEISSDLLFYLPFLVETPSEASKIELPKYQDRAHFMTIGNFIHPPNYNALLYLKETIWPKIRQQLPKAELHNYGAYAPQKVSELHNEKEGFLIKGWAEDVNEVMQDSRMLLAPIRFGAGLKGKIFDALQNGTPLITTTFGAEGIMTPEIANGFICDSPDAFSEAAVKLYENETLWLDKQAKGFEILSTKFSKSHFETEFAARLSRLVQNYKRERQQNFIGQLLQHHSLQSTKYMGKWIEAKHKKP